MALVVGIVLAVDAGAQQAEGRSYGPVKRNDTVSALARQFRGDANLTLNQAMIAIVRANPDAFRDGNINALRQRVILRIPSFEEMAGISPGEAAAEAERHHEAWRNRRRTGSAVPAPAPGTAAVSPATRTQAAAPATAPSPPAAQAPAGEVAELSASLLEAEATIEELRERIAERDQAIEALLAQLARSDTGAASEASSERDAASGSDDEGSMADRLPVNPLVLGSALIVLLILIVVVSLLRRREEEEHRAAGADVAPPDGEAPRGVAGAGAVAGAATGTPPTLETEIDYRALDGLPAADDAVELPIGLDLEDERDSVDRSRADGGASNLEEPIESAGFRRDVDVGALDDLRLDSAADSETDASMDAGEERERSRPLPGARDPASPGD